MKNRRSTPSSASIPEVISSRVESERENILGFLMEFIDHKSINPDRALPEEPGEEKSCQEWLRDRLAEMDVFEKIDLWEVAPGRPNLVGVFGKNYNPEKSIIFNGHVDVVPVTGQQYANWTIGHPWNASVVDGKVYGRGSADMKGGITAVLWAIKTLADLKLPLAGNIVAAMNIGEESSNFDYGSRAVVRRGYLAPLLVNAEPTNLDICPATKGAFFFKINVIGRGIHVAYNNLAIYPSPYGEDITGVSAIAKARQIMDAYDHLNEQWAMHNKHPLSPPGGMNHCLVSIRGGEYLGSVPEQCELIYIVWFNPDHKSSAVMQEIRDVLQSVVERDYWLREHPPELEIPYYGADKNIYETIDIPIDGRECRTIAEAYQEIVGEPARFRCFPAVCDANAYYDMGIPSIIIGPGDLTMGTHAENESVPVEQIITAAKVYANIAVKWLGTEENR
jgi:acetylornithine deacetylase/succinyl-diaminopimelate desuccinylase-like protein